MILTHFLPILAFRPKKLPLLYEIKSLGSTNLNIFFKVGRVTGNRGKFLALFQYFRVSYSICYRQLRSIEIKEELVWNVENAYENACSVILQNFATQTTQNDLPNNIPWLELPLPPTDVINICIGGRDLMSCFARFGTI